MKRLRKFDFVRGVSRFGRSAYLLLLAVVVVGINTSRAQDAPAAAAQASPGGQIEFAHGTDVSEIPASFISNQVFVPLRINHSQPSLFRLDTTAATTSVDPARLAELHVKPSDIPGLNFSGFDYRMTTLQAAAKKDFAAQVGRAYEGTLGNDFLNAIIAEIDYARSTVRFYAPDAYMPPAKVLKLPVNFVDGIPVIRAKFALPKGKAVEADFAVNTAIDAGVVISGKFADSHHLSIPRTISETDPQLGPTGSTSVGRLKEFQIGDFVVEGALAKFVRADMPLSNDGKIAGEIGGAMLRRFTVVLDYPHKQILLAPNANFPQDDHEDMSGISMIALGPGLKTFEVTEVSPGSPAAHEQIQAGDVIIGLDEDPAADLNLESIRDLFRQVGRKYKVILDHKGQMREVTLEMRRRL